MNHVKVDTPVPLGGLTTTTDNAQEYDLSTIAMPPSPVGTPFERATALKDLPVLEPLLFGSMETSPAAKSDKR